MRAGSWKYSRGRVLAPVVVGVLIAASFVGGGAGPVSASGHSPGVTAHRDGGLAAAKRHPKFPRIGNATNLNREPVVHATKGKPPKKLELRDLVVGTGAVVKSTSTVSVFYVGANYKTGEYFTQGPWTTKKPKPTSFPLSGVITGFAEGLIGMKVGGRREIVIPPKLGYGKQGTGPIAPNETLVFVVDLKGVTG